MCARSDQPESRDHALARLAAEALRPRSSPGKACPDAELVAAYADQGLSGGERLQLEGHFAGCERCQRVLAALGAALETPVADSVVVMPAPAAPQPSPQRWLWWLSPAFGAAAAALLWMALRPAAPRPVQTAADYSGIAQQETRAPAPAAPQAAPLSAPPSAPVATERRDAQGLDRLSTRESAVIQGGVVDQIGGAIAGAKVEITDEAQSVVRTLTTDDSGQFTAPALNAGTYTVRAEALGFNALERKNVSIEVGQDARVNLELRPGQQTQTVTVTGQAPLVQARAAAAPAATPAPQALADLPLGGRQFTPLFDLYTYTFASPDGRANWRLGAAGDIERSTDRGQTWQRQSSGVTEDLIAGSASSSDVAWVVGRGRVILRTTDGERWERIAPPAGATGEWTTAVAHSAMSATVVASDFRRFSTEDGGRTWTQQQ